MGHKEEQKSISHLAPRTELSTERDILGISLGGKYEESVLHFKDIFYHHHTSSQGRCWSQRELALNKQVSSLPVHIGERKVDTE